MTQRLITATIAVAFLVSATLAFSGEASAKPGKGSHHHHGFGGPVFIIGAGDYKPDCYMAKKYSRSGRPYLVEVCG